LCSRVPCRCGRKSTVHGAGFLGTLGGVLGDVGRDLLVSEFVITEGCDFSYIDLVAPTQFTFADRVGTEGECGAFAGLFEGDAEPGQQLRGGDGFPVLCA
jgi:hypothetical protein